jgi:DNA-binding transcriptional regulator YiaG
MQATRTSEARAIQRVHRLIQTGRLRELREDSGLSQSDVARHLGVAASNVSRWEAGESRPRSRHAVALLELLDGED